MQFRTLFYYCMEKKTIALCCIVKNEEKTLPRLVDSVREIIDYWVIVDTGSKDKTRELIPMLFGDIQGELHEMEWRNFGWNRTQLCKLAKGKADYLLLLDADMTLTFDGFDKNKLTEPGYHLWYSGPLYYVQMLLVSGQLDWEYVGVTHEFITTTRPVSIVVVKEIAVNHHLDGGMRANKLTRDLALLRHGLIDEPNNSRYVFYLAQTLKDMGKAPEALQSYSQRIKMGGWPEEVWYSMYQSAKMLEKLGKIVEARTAYIEAFEYRPGRAEPLFYLGRMCRQEKLYHQATMFLVGAKRIAQPKSDMLFIEVPVYKYLIDFELSINLYWSGKYHDSLKLCEGLLMDKDLPQNIVKATQGNRQFCLDAIDREASSGEKVLITGAGGMLGTAMYHFFKQKYMYLLATDIDLNEQWLSYLDVRDKAACASLFESFKPTIVIHVAGPSDMEWCEDNPEEARDLIVNGTENVLELSKEKEAKFIGVSSSEVFGNDHVGEYEDDATKLPISAYGDFVNIAEQMILAYKNAWLFRTGWMFGTFKKDKKFVRQLYDQIKGGLKEINVIKDRVSTPVYTYNVVETIYFVFGYGKPGVWNLSNGKASREDVAKEFVHLIGKQLQIKINPVEYDFFKDTYYAPRSKSSALIPQKLEDKGFHYVTEWKQALANYVGEIRQYDQAKDYAVAIIGDQPGLWDKFFDAYDKYWEGFDCNVYFLCGDKSPDRSDMTVIPKCGKHFGDIVRSGVMQIPERYVLLLRDRYILQEKIEKTFFEQAFNMIKTHSISRIGMFYESAKMQYQSQNLRIAGYQVHRVVSQSPDATLMHGIWDKEFLLFCVGDVEHTWDIESVSQKRLDGGEIPASIYHCLGYKDWYEVLEKKSLASHRDTKELQTYKPPLKKRSSNRDELTVLIPVYNRLNLLEECLGSLVNQTYQNFKCVVYDDASQEDIQSVLGGYGPDLDIRYIRGKDNRGEGYSRQRLLEQVNTEYFAWMDSDDKVLPERFEKQIAVLKEDESIDMVYCEMQWFPTGGIIKVDTDKWKSWKGLLNNTTTPTGMFRKKCAETPFSYIRYGNDVLWLYALLMEQRKVAMINEPLYLYRKHDNRISMEKRRFNWEEMLEHNKKRVEMLYKHHKFVVVSMYTVGTPYEQEIKTLEESLLKFNVPYEIYAVPDKGNWEKNTHQKVGVIRDALTKYKHSVVWTDADSVFERFPDLFDGLTCDIAAHKIQQWNEILSGTVYFAYNESVFKFLDAWEELNDAGSGPDAPNMQLLIETREDIIFDYLPAEYVRIFDNPHQQCNDPVIVHNQASRRLKNKSTSELFEGIQTIKRKIVGHKSCAIIGNGPFVTDLSKEINDSFVMRCNNFKIGDEYAGIGTRVDLNISSLHPDIIPTEKVDYPVLGILPISEMMYQKYSDAKQMHAFWKKSFDKLRKMGVDVYSYGDNDEEMKKLFNSIAGAINAFPTVGILAIALAKSWGFKKIIVTGFTFFESEKSHYFMEQKVVPSMHHNVEGEKMLLKSWVHYDKDRDWVLDGLTQKILKGDS